MKIELHTKDGQVLFAQVKSYPSIGEIVVSDDGDSHLICDPGRTHENYPFRMYKVTPCDSTHLQTTSSVAE